MVYRGNQKLNEAIENHIHQWRDTVHGVHIMTMYKDGADYESICEVIGIDIWDYEEE